MNFSSKAKAFIRRLTKQGLESGICYTYLFARVHGHPTHYFPPEYDVLEEVPKADILNEKIDSEWVKEWIKLWPKPGVAGLDYPVSGNYPNVMKKFNKFFKEWDERLPEFKDLLHEDKLELVETATRMYLEQQKERNWEYTQKNHNFIIHDTKGSTLESWIRKADSPIYIRKRVSL